MKKKWFRYFLRECGETTVGIINAENQEDAKLILQDVYTKTNIDNFVISEVQLDKGYCEIYYGG